MDNSHPILTDIGEYFDNDPTVGRGVPRDPDGTIVWQPIECARCTEAFLSEIRQSLPDTKNV